MPPDYSNFRERGKSTHSLHSRMAIRNELVNSKNLTFFPWIRIRFYHVICFHHFISRKEFNQNARKRLTFFFKFSDRVTSFRAGKSLKKLEFQPIKTVDSNILLSK